MPSNTLGTIAGMFGQIVAHFLHETSICSSACRTRFINGCLLGLNVALVPRVHYVKADSESSNYSAESTATT